MLVTLVGARQIQAGSLNAVLAKRILANLPGHSDAKGFAMLCSVCDRPCVKYGKNRNGTRRYFCRKCFLTYSDAGPQVPRVFKDRAITMNQATSVIRLMMDGTSIRGICRFLKLSKRTVLWLLLRVGKGCERLLEQYIVNVPCRSIQCDELWSFVWCKQKTKERKEYRWEEVGDCYTWTAVDRDSKLILTYAVGKRDNTTAMEFVRKLRRATIDHFQIDTDGLGIYRSVIPLVFGPYQDHAQVVKIFGAPPDGEARYSPPQIVGMNVEVGSGWPNLEEASTSFVERSNLTIRMMLRRFTRLTNAHSKSWDHHEAAIALLVAMYNFCRPHETLTEREGRKCTPAVAAGITDHVWTVEELVERIVPDEERAIAS